MNPHLASIAAMKRLKSSGLIVPRVGEAGSGLFNLRRQSRGNPLYYVAHTARAEAPDVDCGPRWIYQVDGKWVIAKVAP